MDPIRNVDPLGEQSYDWYARRNENGSISVINLSGEHDVSKSIVGQDWINVEEDNISAEQAQNNANSYFSPTMSPNRYQGNYHADKVGVSSLTERLAYFDQTLI
ncbi:hypothetical protein [Chitinophaga sp. S165]|uniref:hypothetical protein n=1 Tax=Chitinophaga sp. S165 TaxID=2135462 RepID=UPI001E4A7614|nr:hypothetical protein [Chitinophaga sp. S165]